MLNPSSMGGVLIGKGRNGVLAASTLRIRLLCASNAMDD